MHKTFLEHRSLAFETFRKHKFIFVVVPVLNMGVLLSKHSSLLHNVAIRLLDSHMYVSPSPYPLASFLLGRFIFSCNWTLIIERIYRRVDLCVAELYTVP